MIGIQRMMTLLGLRELNKERRRWRSRNKKRNKENKRNRKIEDKNKLPLKTKKRMLKIKRR